VSYTRLITPGEKAALQFNALADLATLVKVLSIRAASPTSLRDALTIRGRQLPGCLPDEVDFRCCAQAAPQAGTTGLLAVGLVAGIPRRRPHRLLIAPVVPT
jgi:hypothetical protein